MGDRDTASDGWEARFRATRIVSARVAPLRPDRGMVAGNATGTFQLHRWDVVTGALPAITDDPTGRRAGLLAPDGGWVVWHDDTAGDEFGRLVAERWEGGGRLAVGGDDAAGFCFAAAFSPRGRWLAAPMSADGAWRVLLVEWGPDGPGASTWLDAGPGFPAAIAVDDDGRVALTTTGEQGTATTRVRMLGSGDPGGAPMAEIADEGASVLGLAFAPDGTGRLLAASNASGPQRPVVVARDGSVARFPLRNVAGDLMPSGWSPDGRSMLLLGSDRSTTRLWILDGAGGACRAIGHRPAAIGISSQPGEAAQWLPDGGALTVWERGTEPSSVVVLDPDSGAVRRTLLAPAPGPASRPWRSVDIPTTDGETVQGWLVAPGGDGPHPAVIEVHGGPAAQENDRYHPAAQAWVDAGYAVLTLNYRGSTGFGRDYEQCIYGDVGRRELDDVVAAREALVSLGVADPARVLVTGGSYGGYLTLLALTKRPTLWAAGVALVAIADWTLMWEEGVALRAYQEGLFGGTPAEQEAEHREASPLTYAADLRAPLLVIQGRNDPRCPPRQMERFVEEVRAAGGRVEIDWFDAGHGHGGVEQRIAWQRRAMAFAALALGERTVSKP
jgi:acetyl esterase/lipase